MLFIIHGKSLLEGSIQHQKHDNILVIEHKAWQFQGILSARYKALYPRML